jgi:hypothetical protein
VVGAVDIAGGFWGRGEDAGLLTGNGEVYATGRVEKIEARAEGRLTYGVEKGCSSPLVLRAIY